MPDTRKIIEIVRRREDLVDRVPAEFIDVLEDIQNQVYRDILDVVKGMETASGGALRNNEFNKRLAFSMRGQIRRFLRDSGYYEKVTGFGRSYRRLIDAAKDYYGELDLDPEFTERDLQTLSQIRKDDVNFLMTRDNDVINVTYREVTASINSRGDWRDLADKLKDLHTDRRQGDQVLNGLLKKYNRTYAQTAYGSFDRKIQNIKSSQLGLKYYLYSGSLLRDSREFCRRRAGKIFTEDEINSWQDMSWTGKAEGRSVWEYLGGWNCQHILSPVTAALARRREELERMYDAAAEA